MDPSRCIYAIACVFIGLALSACASQFPQRPYVNTSGVSPKLSRQCEAGLHVDGKTTPEVGENFTIHFVEFDDHGWTYADESTRYEVPARFGNPSLQLDCAIEHLAESLKENGKVALYLYVHGWHRNAAPDDKDVDKFRKLMQRYADTPNGRKTIGIFVGWDGETVPIPYVGDVLTFFPRKNAAHRVADGRLRELFGRIKGLREFHNRDDKGSDCAERQSHVEDRCRFRAVMIGHSFGGLILYSAVQPYLLQTLTTGRDLGPSGLAIQEPRSRGIADLIVLVNPAFEATLYEPVHRAARNYLGNSSTPLLVSLTSSADWAVGKAFQIARTVSTAMQSTNSRLGSEAIRDTIGNVESYLTHYLCVKVDGCDHPRVVQHPGFVPICGMQLHQLTKDMPVWNVRANKDIMAGHNDILREYTINFFEYVYSLNTKGRPPCLEQEKESSVLNLPPPRLIAPK